MPNADDDHTVLDNPAASGTDAQSPQVDSGRKPVPEGVTVDGKPAHELNPDVPPKSGMIREKEHQGDGNWKWSEWFDPNERAQALRDDEARKLAQRRGSPDTAK